MKYVLLLYVMDKIQFQKNPTQPPERCATQNVQIQRARHVVPLDAHNLASGMAAHNLCAQPARTTLHTTIAERTKRTTQPCMTQRTTPPHTTTPEQPHRLCTQRIFPVRYCSSNENLCTVLNLNLGLRMLPLFVL